MGRRAAILIMLAAIAGLTASDMRASSRTPPLHWAASRGYAAMVELLLRNGADIEQRDLIGRTALHRGARHPAVVELLLQSGADVTATDAFDNTALHLGVRYQPVVELLLDAGVDVNARNHVQRSALDYAVRNGESRYNLAIIERLIGAGAR
ncbi:MAG: ankyrin repeat domain-containing protein [Spirochaetaceae bacterium]|nr:MAG: ankyrin repeat domain-containing protein [Spirochaetaceae bacterium]